MRTLALVPCVLLFGCGSHPVSGVPQTDVVKSPALSGTVDLVRDEWGIPHIYGDNLPDVAFVQGYVTAEDRLFQMDLVRHQSSGTLAELLGDLSPAVIDRDIEMRVHHLRATAQAAWTMLSASTDPTDQATAKMMSAYAAGVNAYLADLQSQRYTLPQALSFLYDISTVKPWTEADCLLVGQRLAFELSFDAASEIFRSALDLAEQQKLVASTSPALQMRAGLAADFESPRPVDPTYTLPSGWTGMGGDSTRADLLPASLGAVLAAASKSVENLGHDHQIHPSLGSNNWVIGPSLSKTGHAMVANDTHLTLGNPPIFYMAHLVARGKLDVMGEQFPGIPGIILGLNEHVAWGATVNNIDVTDVYAETVVPCDAGGAPCVKWKGSLVPLVPRQEKIDVGRFGQITSSVTVTLWEVPHHGPILPRVTKDHGVEPLASNEVSIRYTGYEPAPRIATTILGLDTSSSLTEAVAAIDRGFIYGNQNWVIGDDKGHIGWTEFTRVPRRAPTAAPWKVLPGDGSAEWGGDLDPRYIPHAYDPAAGFLATANADPIGVTDDGDPFFDEPNVDGAPLYLGFDYDPGTRVGRITKRIKQASGKLTLDDLQSIQADDVSEWSEQLLPTFVDAAGALIEEWNAPGTHKDLSIVAEMASPPSKALTPLVLDWARSYSSRTPSGVAEDNPSAAEVADARTAAVVQVWMRRFADRTFEDELTTIGLTPSSFDQLKLLVRMCTHTELLKTPLDPQTGDPVLFDVWDTPEHETKREQAAHAILDALDYLVGALGPDATAWRWGAMHTLTLSFPAPVPQLQIPLKSEAAYANGFPRHGALGTVDVGGDSIDIGDYTYAHGPAIRFVAELDPAGPKARNALPGGEIFDPASPHYRDMLELWRKNQTFDLVFKESDVARSATRELGKHGDGRVRFGPK